MQKNSNRSRDKQRRCLFQGIDASLKNPFVSKRTTKRPTLSLRPLDQARYSLHELNSGKLADLQPDSFGSDRRRECRLVLSWLLSRTERPFIVDKYLSTYVRSTYVRFRSITNLERKGKKKKILLGSGTDFFVFRFTSIDRFIFFENRISIESRENSYSLIQQRVQSCDKIT